MPPMSTIRLLKPIAAARVGDALRACAEEGSPERPEDHGRIPSDDTLPHERSSDDRVRESPRQQAELARLLQTVNSLAGSLRQLHERTLADHHAEIARLAMEIARRILMVKVSQGDYEIQAIVEEALQQAPTRQSMVVHLNPEDLPRCRQLQQENPQSPLAELELLPDGSIGRGECLVETPKGIVKSFIEEHLEHISEAMQRVEQP